MRLRHVSLGLAVLACSTCFALTKIYRTADPALSPDGKTVAFSWQGDIWTVSSQGGLATRLTVHPAPDEFPVWSPDGQFIYFSSSRFGASNLFRMRPDGTDLKRITYESAPTYPTSVSSDGKYIYGYTTAWGRSNLFCVSTEGGDLVRLTMHPLETQFTPDVSADGTTVVFCEGGSAGEWRKPGQHGSNTPKLYTGRAGAPLSDLKQVTTDDWLNMYPRFLADGRILEMSNRSGAHNLWTINRDGKGSKLVTHFDSGTIRALTVSKDNHTAAFQRNSRIWLTNLESGESHPMEISVPDDSRRSATQSLTLATGATHISVSPNGKRSAIDLRGDVFIMPASGGTTKQLTTNPAWDGQSEWLDDKSIVYASAAEADGRRNLHTLGTDGTDKVFEDSPVDLIHPLPSPDHKWVAFQRGEHEIVVVPSAGGTPKVVATGRFGDSLNGPRVFNWSPDSQWLGVSSPTDRDSYEVRAVRIDGTKSTLVARAGKTTSAPQFFANGKGLFYVGTEGLDYNEARDTKEALFAVDFSPEPITYAEDDLDKIDESAKRDDSAPQVNIVDKGLALRKRKVLDDVQGAWAGADGSVIYAQSGKTFLRIQGIRVTPVAAITTPVSQVVATKGKLTILSESKIYSLADKAEALAPAPYSAHLTVDARREEMALFTEAWWALDRLYYDPKHHGKDWVGVRKEFSDYVSQATSREDFYNIMGEMVERLDSSHQGATSSEVYRTDTPQTAAWLGVEFDPASLDQGKYAVSYVYAEGPAAHPDMELRVGDQILAVNGDAPTSQRPLSALLVDQLGRKVTLKVTRSGVLTSVTIKPISSANRTKMEYEDWVRRNRAEVDSMSHGQLGYLHIAAMDAASLDRFLTEIQTETIGKKGVLVDVRFNGGGFTSHIILNIMRKMTWLKRTFRDNTSSYLSENIMRGNALELPAACLTNQFSFSNAEIFSEGFKRLGLGPVIGEPTAGGCIGTGSYSLWDGGAIRMPAIGVYTLDGEDLERNGRKPDFYVPYDPTSWMQGQDTQLDKAVAELLKKVK